MLHNMAHLKRARAYGNSAAAAKDRSGKRAVERSRYNQNHEECGHNDWWDEPALGCVGPRPIVSACDCRGCVDLTFSGIDHTILPHVMELRHIKRCIGLPTGNKAMMLSNVLHGCIAD